MNLRAHRVITILLFVSMTTLGVRGEDGRAFELIVAPATLENPRNDHQLIFKMKDGRLLLAWSEYYVNRPSRIARTAYTGKGGSPILDSRRISARISEDRGRSWSDKFVLQVDQYPLNVRGGGNLLRLASDEILFFYGIMEPSIVELKDGSLLMVLRSNLGKVYQAFSKDQGNTWSKAEPTRLDAPAAEHLLARIPTTGDLLLVWNHTKPTINNSLPRTPLTSAISRDEGRSWTHFRDIETHVGYDCAYPAVTFLEDEALITYYYGNRADTPGWYSVKLKIVPIGWLYQE